MKQYDSCKVGKKECREILDFLETQGMLPPGVEDLAYKAYYGHDHDYEAIFRNEWEK